MPDPSGKGVNTPSAKREAVLRNAQTHFTAAERRDNDIRAEIAREQAATTAKTAKLRALRLAKEEADRIAAANAPKPAPKTRKAKAGA